MLLKTRCCIFIHILHIIKAISYFIIPIVTDDIDDDIIYGLILVDVVGLEKQRYKYGSSQ